MEESVTDSTTTEKGAEIGAHEAVASLRRALADNAEFYHASAINCTHEAVASMLRERASARTGFAHQLAEADSVQDEVAEPSAATGEWLAGLRRGLMAVTAALIIERDLTVEYVLNECQEADRRLLEQYRAALETEDLAAGMRRQIEAQQAQIEASYTATGARLGAPATADSVVFGIFPDTDDLLGASDALRALGLAEEQITIIGTTGPVEKVLGDRKRELAASGAGVSAIGGSLLGGLLGLIAGIGIVMLPGVGAVLAIGAVTTVIGSTAAGAGIGAAQGAFLGMLVGWGVGEEDTQRFTAAVSQGETLLVAHVPSSLEKEAAAIMRRHRASDVTIRVDEGIVDQS